MRSAFPPYACYDRLVRRIGEQRRQALGAATAGPQRVDGRHEAGHKRRKERRSWRGEGNFLNRSWPGSTRPSTTYESRS